MLRFILGKAGSGKTHRIYEEICKEKGNVLLLVPDQFLFETEKLIAQRTGEKSRNIKIAGISSLSEEILKKYCPRKSYADSTAKLMIMLKTIREVRSSLGFYGGSAYKNSFVSLCLDTVNSFKQAGITAERLSSAAANANGHLGKKLRDVSLIYELYSENLSQVFADRLDNLALAASAAEENDCFAGYKVFIDGFDSFSGSQLRFLEPIVRQSVDCTAALCLSDSGGMCFEAAEKTKARLSYFAELENAEITEEYLDEAPRYKSAELEYLRDILPEEKLTPYDGVCENINIAYSTDIHKEADYVCSQIKKLLREGCRYSDITILCPSPIEYSGAVASAAHRYEIPQFEDIPVPISDKPLLKYIDFLLNAAAEPTGDNVLRYLKSGFVRIPKKDGGSKAIQLSEIYKLEEYCSYWDIYSRDWSRAFPHIEADAEKQLELLRQSIVTPLVNLKKNCNSCDGAEITEKLTDFLFNSADIRTAIEGKCRDMSSDSLKHDKKLTEEYNQLWGMVSALLSSAFETMEGMQLQLKEYAAVLKACAEQISMLKTPHVLDSVLFGDPSRTRSAGAKAVFVMGAASGSFPAFSGDTGSIFTAKETEWLSENGFEAISSAEDEYILQLLSVYRALTLASDKLYITWHGTADTAAESVQLTAKAFGIEYSFIDSLPPEFFCESVASARKQLAGCSLTDNPSAELITQALKQCGDNDYLRLVKSAVSKSSPDSHKHIIGDTAPLIFPEQGLSPTAINSLNGCRFSYFCRYGLKLREKTSIRLNSINFGNIVHFVLKECFENIFNSENENSGIKDYIDSDYRDMVRLAADKYRKEFLLDEADLSARFNALYHNLEALCFYMLKYMVNELKKSRFVPSYFELTLESGKTLDNGFKAEPFSFDIELNDGTRQTVQIYGTVDRVDTAKADGRQELRVIDYKTGSRDMSMGRVYYGLDLQLLLYLFTLCENNNEYGAASATYYPAGKIPLKNSRNPSDELLRGMWLKEHKELGIAVDNSFADIEKENYNIIAPSDSGKISRSNCFAAMLISPENLEKLKKRVTDTVRQSIEAVKSGDVSAYPISENGELISCNYCRYSAICGRNAENARMADGTEAAEFENDILEYERRAEEKEQQKKAQKTQKGGGK